MAVFDRQHDDISETLKEVAVAYAGDGLFTGFLHSDDPQPLYEYSNDIASLARWVGVMHHGNCNLDARRGLLRVAALAIAAVRELDRAAKQTASPNTNSA